MGQVIKTATDVESAIRRVMGDATGGVVQEIVSIHREMEAVPVRLSAPDGMDTDTLLDRTIVAIQAAESEIEQSRPRLERVRQVMEDALDNGEYQARSLVIRPALAGEVDKRLESVRTAQAAKVEQLMALPRLSTLRSERKSLTNYRATIAEQPTGLVPDTDPCSPPRPTAHPAPAAGLRGVDRQQVIVDHHPVGRMRPRQAIAPAPVGLRPCTPRVVQPASKQELAQAVPTPLSVRERVIAGSAQVANRFFGRRRRPYHR